MKIPAKGKNGKPGTAGLPKGFRTDLLAQSRNPQSL
jgi:hypothetical protein